MSYKHLVGAVVVAAIGIVSVYFLVEKFPATTNDVVTDEMSELEATPSLQTAENGINVPTEANENSLGVSEAVTELSPAPTATTVPSPVPVAPTAPTVKIFTMAEVATRNTEANCWTAIEGKVYDLTAFINKHPGGDRNILRICGIDGTKAFTGQHGGQGGPERTLGEFYLGDIK
jgi:cytochrome b involved in lipid metabolism